MAEAPKPRVPPRPPSDTRTTMPAMPAASVGDRPPLSRVLEEGASEEQIRFATLEALRVYANAYAELMAERSQVITKLDAILTEQRNVRRAQSRADEEIETVKLKVGGLEVVLGHITGRVTALEQAAANDISARLVAQGAAQPSIGPSIPPPGSSVPPMRDRQASTHDAAEETGRVVAEKFQAEKANPHTPPPDAALVQKLVEEQVAIVLTHTKEAEDRKKVELEAAQYRQIVQEREDAQAKLVAAAQKAEEERVRVEKEAQRRAQALLDLNAREKIKTRWKMIALSFAGAVAGIGWLAEHFLRH
jgi:hypothetical protein